MALLATVSVAARDFAVTDFGAVANDAVLDTAAIQRAIDEATAAGGGRVVLAGGVFRSGALFLRQGVEFHVAAGTTLLGSNRIEDYPRAPTRIEGKRQEWRVALLNAANLTGVRITGAGVVDGNGILFWAAFWQRRKENPKCTNLEVERPRMMFLDSCRDVRIEGLTFRDSGFWNLHLYRCRDVAIEGVTIKAPDSGSIRAPSSDGIDLDSCRDVVVRRTAISVGDDCIALKGTKGPHADQDADSPPVENILIEDCTFGEGHGVLTCGSEATLVRNVTVRRCTVTGANNLLSLKLRRDTPQRYEDIVVEDIELNVAAGGRLLKVQPWAQFFDLGGEPQPRVSVKNVTVRNVRGTIGGVGTLVTHETATIEGFTLENIELTVADAKLVATDGVGLTVKNVAVNGTVLERVAR
ncbi:MAG: exopolygalacturonase [Opitutae bacterium]|nr:exopolygalacturonase [Opitutae bacterium]